MAKRSNRRGMKKIEPAQLDLYFRTDPTTPGTDSRWYIDTARELSKVNRRKYSQTKCYAYQGLTFIWNTNVSNVATIEVAVKTAGNTWVVHNAFVKGKALWDEMQALVLDDNPSIAGKWHDYKIQLVDTQSTARELSALDGDGFAYTVGGAEWNIATYVMPQHEIDLATGEPLPAEEFTALLIGDDTPSKRSLVKAYQESRATVQSPMPNVPAGMATSFFNLLTDSGSQEPELATVIEDENDLPPYDRDNYPGGDANATHPVIVQYGAISAAEVDGRVGGFIAPCGLIEVEIKGYDAAGNQIDNAQMPDIGLLLHVAPGAYRGVAAVDMGQ